MLHHHLLVTIKSSRFLLTPPDPLIPSQSQSGLSGHHHLPPDPCCALLDSVIASWSPPSPSGPHCLQLCFTISLWSPSGPSGHHHPCLSLVVPSWSLPPAPRPHHPLLVPITSSWSLSPPPCPHHSPPVLIVSSWSPPLIPSGPHHPLLVPTLSSGSPPPPSDPHHLLQPPEGAGLPMSPNEPSPDWRTSVCSPWLLGLGHGSQDRQQHLGVISKLVIKCWGEGGGRSQGFRLGNPAASVTELGHGL